MSRRKQDEFTRYRRLSRGCCPTHGIAMTQIGVDLDKAEYIVECPWRTCDFVYQVPAGSRTDYALQVEMTNEANREEAERRWRERLAALNGETP